MKSKNKQEYQSISILKPFEQLSEALARIQDAALAERFKNDMRYDLFFNPRNPNTSNKFAILRISNTTKQIDILIIPKKITKALYVQSILQQIRQLNPDVSEEPLAQEPMHDGTRRAGTRRAQVCCGCGLFRRNKNNSQTGEQLENLVGDELHNPKQKQ